MTYEFIDDLLKDSPYSTIKTLGLLLREMLDLFERTPELRDDTADWQKRAREMLELVDDKYAAYPTSHKEFLEVGQ